MTQISSKAPFQLFPPAEFNAARERVPALIEAAIARVREAPFNLSKAYVGHSGGKDSVLVRYIVDHAIGYDFPTVHTTKPAGVQNEVHVLTREFLYSMDRCIFYVPLDRCESLRTAFGFETQIDGTRRSEHDRSNGRAVDVVIDGKPVSRINMPMYLENGLFGLNFIYPIVDWTDIEVWAAIHDLAIDYSPEYEVL